MARQIDTPIAPGVITANAQTENGSPPTAARLRRGQKPRQTDDDDFICEVEQAPALVPEGQYDVRVDRLERWKFPSSLDAWKLTFHCRVFGGPYNNVILLYRIPWHWPATWGSKLGDVIRLAAGGSIPRRSSRISLKRLFTGRLFRAQVRTLVSPRRDRFGRPVVGQDGQIIEKCRASVVDQFLEALTEAPSDYLL